MFDAPLGGEHDPPEVGKDIRCQGILGSTLNDALDEILDEDIHGAIREDNVNSEGMVNHVRINNSMKEKILNEFGASFRNRQRMTKAPAVLLKGRIIYYCRIESRWRIRLDDARIVRRKDLTPKRRRSLRMSLWSMAKDDARNVEGERKPETHSQSLLLNLYNDEE